MTSISKVLVPLLLLVATAYAEPKFNGLISFGSAGNLVSYRIDQIYNNSAIYATGTIRVSVYGLYYPYDGGVGYGTFLYSGLLDPLYPNYVYNNLTGTVAFNYPPSNYTYLAMLLDEYTIYGYRQTDYVTMEVSTYFPNYYSAPSILTNPISNTVTAGSSHTFSVVSSGSATLTYQWRKNGSSISGATSSTYSISSTSTSDAGSYTVVVTNSAGSATSNAATLTVTAAATAPTITTQPSSRSVTSGSAASFSVVASGTATLTFQWKKDGSSISGATSSTYSISSTSTSDAGSYTVVVTNSAGSATSNAATLTVTPAPVILSGPANVSVTVGNGATFSVVSTGTALTYQWRKNGVNISGATSATLSFSSTQLTDVGNYSVMVSNAGGSVVSTAATLTFNQVSPPVITASPNTGTVVAGQNLTLTVSATGIGLSYQWRKDGAPIVGATGSSLSILTVTANDAGSYSVIVTNAGGFVISSAAGIAVSTGTSPVFTAAPSNVSAGMGGAATFVSLSGSDQWRLNGTTIAGATGTSLTVLNIEPVKAGLYSASRISGGVSVSSLPAILGVASAAKLIGAGTEFPNIAHSNGWVYDQILLQGDAASVTADPGQILRMSYVDTTNDIVQVEFSGSGTLTLVLAGVSGPEFPVNYNQGVGYMKGHAGIIISGAAEDTHLTVYSVGRANAVNKTLFRSDVTYDGIADIAFIAITSTDGKFGGLRAANAHIWESRGFTGLYAPNVQFTGPVFVGDISASSDATPVMIIGSGSDVRITGGDLLQANGRAIQVKGISQLKFSAAYDSHGNFFAAKNNQAQLEQEGLNVNSQVVVNP